jgi:hypothetical protein
MAININVQTYKEEEEPMIIDLNGDDDDDVDTGSGIIHSFDLSIDGVDEEGLSLGKLTSISFFFFFCRGNRIEAKKGMERKPFPLHHTVSLCPPIKHIIYQRFNWVNRTKRELGLCCYDSNDYKHLLASSPAVCARSLKKQCLTYPLV